MDIRITGAEANAEEKAAVDALLGAALSNWEGAARGGADDNRMARVGYAQSRERRDLLLPALHTVQDRVGWVSEGALNYICQRLIVPPADAWGVVTFYHLFSTEPRPKSVAHVCDDLACRLHGAERLCSELEVSIGPERQPAKDGDFCWQRSPCLGQCERAPAVLIERAGEAPQSDVMAPASASGLLSILSTSSMPSISPLSLSVPQLGSPDLRLLSRVGTVNPESLEAFRASGGYAALDKALVLGPQGVIAEVLASKLVGRGGAAFPTGRKWQAVAAQAAKPHYLVLNADESEPGTFKDRVLLEEDPFGIVEAMTLAAYACGCERGFIYLRGEYPLAHRRLSHAIAETRRAGLLGENVAGSGFAFELEIRRGAGAYICGEETALFNSIEGKRGEPRSKPPFPVEVGLFGKPTVVNNVETIASVPWILRLGGEAFAATGSGMSTGTKLFCVSGQVNRPGLYEVPFGVILGELLELAGGVEGGKALQAVLLGGAAGAFVGPEALTTPLTFEGTRAIGATLGSGVVLVYDETADLPDALRRIARFFRHESCGQCVPCRVGTVRQEELLARLASGHTHGSAADELALYAELSQVMRDASICGLGQTASSAIESALKRFAPFAAGGRT